VKQLSEADIRNRKIDLRKQQTTTPFSEKHPVILSTLMTVAVLGALTAVLWFAGVAQ